MYHALTQSQIDRLCDAAITCVLPQYRDLVLGICDRHRRHLPLTESQVRTILRTTLTGMGRRWQTHDDVPTLIRLWLGEAGPAPAQTAASVASAPSHSDSDSELVRVLTRVADAVEQIAQTLSVRAPAPGTGFGRARVTGADYDPDLWTGGT